MNTHLFDDAAPLAGGAGVTDTNGSPKSMQMSLTPPAHRNAPAGTSSVAARRIAGHARIQRARIMALIMERGAYGVIDDEGEAILKIKPQSYTPRRGELVKLGLIVDSGRRRKTDSGRPAAVWVASCHAPKPEGGAA